MSDWKHYLDAADCRPGATPPAIAEAEKLFGLEFPREYVEWLKFTNGYTGWIGENRRRYVDLWRVEELRSLNDGYRVPDWALGALVFGSTGGGEAFAFDMRTAQHRIVQLPWIGMEWKVALARGDTLHEFFQLKSEGKFD